MEYDCYLEIISLFLHMCHFDFVISETEKNRNKLLE